MREVAGLDSRRYNIRDLTRDSRESLSVHRRYVGTSTAWLARHSNISTSSPTLGGFGHFTCKGNLDRQSAFAILLRA